MTTTFDNRWQEITRTWRSNAWLFGVFGFVLGMLAAPTAEQVFTGTRELLAGLVPETFGIIFTVLIIDRLYRNREQRRIANELHDKLAREAQSQINGVARRALEELRSRGWLAGEHGALRGTYLGNADFSGENLAEANFEGTILSEANLAGSSAWDAMFKGASLQGTNLSQARLIGSDFTNANLFGANLTAANLREALFTGAVLAEADLRGADLTGAQLTGARLAMTIGAEAFTALLDETTTLPDGSAWIPDTDMARFTDPDHPNFWQPGQAHDSGTMQS